MHDGDDTIAAIATAVGIGGVGIVRLSGPRAIAIACDALGVTSLDRTVRVGHVRGVDGAPIDQVIAFAMAGPASFTGEDVAELQGHGGSVNLGKLLAAVIDRGARVAEPGEFTRRAVANNRLSLVRAEALLEVIHAGSERAWRLAQQNLAGKLGGEIAVLEQRALAVLAELEGWIDFPDEELDVASTEWIAAEIAEVGARCTALAEGFRRGRGISKGITVALVGAVNVGKSSLMNALVGSERALVAPEPGTTRDWIEVSDVWSGIAVTIIDTAGQRDTDDPIERRGIALGERRVDNADVVVVVNDGVAPWNDGARYGARGIVVRSKIDLGGSSAEGLATSATTGVGLDLLRGRVLEVAGVAEREGSEDLVVTTARQHALAATSGAAFREALAVWNARRAPELAAVELRQGVHALAELRGVEVGERVLDEVFARFCIGK